jgi:hypothetical protein
LKKGDEVNEENFQAISITGCNRGKTGPMLTTDYKLIASFYFTLSATPSEEWIHIFEQVRHERNQQSSARPLPTRVDSRAIVIKCRPSDLQQHFDDLKTDVAASNQNYCQSLARMARDENIERTLAQEIEAALAELKL